MKKNLLLYCGLVALLVVSYTTSKILTNSYSDISLKPSGISYVIAQSLETGGSNKLPIEGLNYNIHSVKYFDNKSWVVVSIIPINSSANSALIVLHKQGTSYNVALGPGDGFSDIALHALPTNVSEYLQGGN